MLKEILDELPSRGGGDKKKTVALNPRPATARGSSGKVSYRDRLVCAFPFASKSPKESSILSH